MKYAKLKTEIQKQQQCIVMTMSRAKIKRLIKQSRISRTNQQNYPIAKISEWMRETGRLKQSSLNKK